ncbi:hypothetical protein KFL_005610040 [Klebsormidium nitens]|uniref:BTB domain-containing protein n=1 Tax=Klebsormidium nitens TaxID=105231 RepID=A0A1Y1IMF3_KLENI|nr:hypothetical protein KFL_005610040 [Klebsormidium nitens]|eukprot:GAQ89777.1 hypothetical protein KFL_005610040 [Klebsormidium nitens]
MTPLSAKISPYSEDWESPTEYFGVVKDSKYTVIGVTLSTERRVSKREWGALQCERAPAPKSALLKSAARTGDIILVGGEGVEAAAHSAVLVDVPYFEAKLREEWSGTTGWNLHNKLRLRLPCAVDQKTLKLFLRCIYGDVKPLYKVEPTSLLLQEVLALADACNIPDVCADVIRVVEVTSENVNSWLEWLLKEHGADAEPIQQQVVKVMRDQLQSALERQKLTVEQLAAMSRFLAGSDSLQVAP